MQWYFSKGTSGQQGPVSEQVIQEKIASGELSRDDLAWREGQGDWKPIRDIPELAGSPPPVGAGGSPYTPPATMSAGGGEDIQNYLWQSIVVTILCCWPLGIPAIIYAAKVDGLKARGDIAGAREAAKNAKMWCGIALGLGLLIILGYIILIGAVGIAEM